MINHFTIFSMENIEKTKKITSSESLEDKNKEQNDIIHRAEEMSVEDDESFEDAANNDASNEDDSGGDDIDSMDSEMDSLDDMGDDMDDMGSGDDSGGDDMGGGDDNSDGGVDKLDKNRGSSLNPFTQINQKNYLIGELNELSDSIQHTITEYNTMYADWSELNQLRELKKMLDEERNSFIMQQNPENLIKLRLYMTQYETIVKKLSNMISDKAKRETKLTEVNKINPSSKN